MAVEATKKGVFSEFLGKGILGAALALCVAFIAALPSFISFPIGVGFAIGGAIGIVNALAS